MAARASRHAVEVALMLPPFARFQASGAASSAAWLFALLQDNVGKALDRLLSNPRHDFVSVKGASLAGAANTTVQHKLGRVPIGWTLTDLTGNDATVRRISWDDKTIVLRASAAVTASVEVW